jgi:alanine dehydrogenase
MRIGVPKEIKDRESRVGVTPTGVADLVGLGHEVLVESDLGAGSGFENGEYAQAGARLAEAKEVWDSELVVKVKEPLPSEYPYLNGQIVFTYLHLAGVTPTLTRALLESQTTAIAYETVEDADGQLPLLAPMSGVAGNMAVAVGNHYLGTPNGGRGILLGQVLGQSSGKVLVIGDGVVGRHAARTAAALGATVTIAGRHRERVPELKRDTSQDLQFVLSEPESIAARAAESDLVVGAVLLRGARAPYVMTAGMVASMRSGSVIVDVSIDQGGCIETSRPTSHSQPTYVVHNVTHYCVTNMPGAYPRTSTIALTTATLPYVRRLAEDGLQALERDPGFAKGLNTDRGRITCRAISEALDLGSPS